MVFTFNMTENGIVVSDDNCWICGNKFGQEHIKTMHHTIPKHLLPKKNVQVPICQKCHDKLTSTDTSALVAFGYSLMKNSKELVTKTDKLVSHLNKR